ncbi:MAG: HD domain-containing protein, partial [Methylococcaceae bacterium]|nr:HD domain-containing protein [Methylococcaceae bacterium]
GISTFMIISFFHDGLDTTRSIESYYIPMLVGFSVGTMMGLMISILINKNKQEQQFFLNIIETLANTLDERDKYTHGHSRRVTNLSLALGDKIGLRPNDLELLRLASILHDIGKIGVPDNILLKHGKLSTEEFEIIKNHPSQGEHILKPMKHDRKISQIILIVRHHHERFDGKGYPDGLTGKKIPLLARVVAVSDSYDAMTSDRPYRKGMTKKMALTEIEKGTGTQYDPNLAIPFISMMEKYGEIECPFRSTCGIFYRINDTKDISAAYNAQFCSGLHQSCARYKIRNKKNMPDNLLPDGSFLQN